MVETDRMDVIIMILIGMNASILVVDDDVSICRILQAMLASEQYRAQTSDSVANALETIKLGPFDLYVIDYKLQDGSGLDIAERIRSRWGNVPIILISGYDRSFFAAKAEKLGITEFIEKPFSRESICAMVKKAIGAEPTTNAAVPQSQANGPKRQSVISRILSRF